MVESSHPAVTPATFSLGEALSWGGSVPLQPALPFVAEVVPAPGSLPSLAEELESVPEHRRPRGFRSDQPPVLLIPSLLLLLTGVLGGKGGFGSIADWGRLCAKDEPAVLDLLGFPPGRQPRTPAAATLFRLTRDMDRAKFQAALQRWLEKTAKALHLTRPPWEKAAIPEDQIALDGKTVRGASKRREGEGSGEVGVHLVAAYVPALQTVLDQLATEGKGHELAAVEMLLGRLPLKGRVITGDALLTQRSVCQTVKDREGDYLLPVKENQPALLGDLQEAFSPSAVGGSGGARDAGCAGRGKAAAPDLAGCPPERGTGSRAEGEPRAV